MRGLRSGLLEGRDAVSLLCFDAEDADQVKGIDMILEYCRQHFDETLVGLAIVGLDFESKGPQGQFYTGPLATPGSA